MMVMMIMIMIMIMMMVMVVVMMMMIRMIVGGYMGRRQPPVTPTRTQLSRPPAFL